MANFMLALVPTLMALMASLGHITSVSLFHPLIIFAVNLMASLIRNAIFPLFSLRRFFIWPTISLRILKLAGWRISLRIFAFGPRPDADAFYRPYGCAGSCRKHWRCSDAAHSQVYDRHLHTCGRKNAGRFSRNSSGIFLLIKNSATVAGLVMLAMIIVFPLLKLLALVIIYKLSGALIQPLETALGEALQTMSNCLVLIFAAVATVALAFLSERQSLSVPAMQRSCFAKRRLR